jgi:hypothetical protein
MRFGPCKAHNGAIRIVKDRLGLKSTRFGRTMNAFQVFSVLCLNPILYRGLKPWREAPTVGRKLLDCEMCLNRSRPRLTLASHVLRYLRN